MGCGEVLPEPLRVGTVDADDGRAKPDDELARLVLAVGCDRVLEVGDDRVGLGGECLRQLRLVGAGGEEQRAETVERSRLSFMSDIRTGRKSGRRLLLDSHSKVRHKGASAPSSSGEVTA
jgi:hypothetical protein